MNVTNCYDKMLQAITGRAFEPVIVSEGITFVEYLYFIFSSYPEIEERYPPGFVGFLINGKRPTDFTILKEGDIIYFNVTNFLTN